MLGKNDKYMAIHVLFEILESNEGCISSKAYKKEMEKRSVDDVDGAAKFVKYFDYDTMGAEWPDDLAVFRWFHSGRSFYSADAYEDAQDEIGEEADRAEKQAASRKRLETEGRDEPSSSARKAEESRLCTYVENALESLYDSEYLGDETDFVFDVHDSRGGKKYENVDLFAIHWRTESCWEIVSVEVKLQFDSKVVQQARNYTRFSDRVWIAVPVSGDHKNAGVELRDTDPGLFEHALRSGLGILACKRGRGRSYDVRPVHWPSKQDIDTYDRESFIERFREDLEEAGLVEKKGLRKTIV